jgi:SH3 domain protein
MTVDHLKSAIRFFNTEDNMRFLILFIFLSLFPPYLIAQSEQKQLALNRKSTKILEQNAELEKRITKKQRNNQMLWFTRGTVLALISVTIGYLLGLFGRKKGQSNP